MKQSLIFAWAAIGLLILWNLALASNIRAASTPGTKAQLNNESLYAGQSALEKRVKALEEDRELASDMEAVRLANPVRPAPKPVAPRYELIIMGQDGPRRVFSSAAICAGARQAIIDQQAAQCPQNAICNPYKVICSPTD